MDRYWQVNPHQWGEGKIHLYDGEVVVCRKGYRAQIDRLPEGHEVDPRRKELNCKGCIRIIQIRELEAAVDELPDPPRYQFENGREYQNRIQHWRRMAKRPQNAWFWHEGDRMAWERWRNG